MNSRSLPPSREKNSRAGLGQSHLIPFPSSARPSRNEPDVPERANPARDLETIVTVNSTVTLIDLASGAERTCTIVEPQNLLVFRGAVSVLHPLGNSLVGRVLGDTIECWELTRHRRVRIAAILFHEGIAPIETGTKAEETGNPALP